MTREIHERPGPLWLCEFLGGPLDGWIEIHDGGIARQVVRKWYPINRGAGPVLPAHYVYEITDPEFDPWQSARVEYVLVDIQPSPGK